MFEFFLLSQVGFNIDVQDRQDGGEYAVLPLFMLLQHHLHNRIIPGLVDLLLEVAKAGQPGLQEF